MVDVERIGLPTPFGVGTVNCYVVGGTRLTLIDPGPAYEDSIMELDTKLSGLGFAITDIDDVLITHEHIDHGGVARHLKDRAHARVIAHEVAADRLSDPTTHFAREQAFFEPYLIEMGVPAETAAMVTSLPEPYIDFQEPVTVDRELEDGDSVPIGSELSLDVVHTPGHAPGAVCFGLEQKDIAFTGDHVLMDITPNPLLTVDPDADTTRTRSLPTYLDSLRKVRFLDVSVGYGGHRDTIPDLHERVRETLSHHDHRKERIAAMLKEQGPTTPYRLMREFFPNLPATETFAGMSEVIGHLDLLEDEDRVQRIPENGHTLYRLL